MKISRLLPALLVISLGLSACGNQQKEEYNEAQQDLARGNYEEALTGFQTAVSNDIELAEAYRGQGIALLRLNRYDEAIEAFSTALAQEEGGKAFQRDVWLYKGTAEFRKGDLDTALKSVQAAIEQGGDQQCYLLLGKIQLEMDNYEDAAASFQSAVQQVDSYEGYIEVYQTYVEQDMAADGEVYLKEALEISSGSAEDDYQRGRIYYFLGDKDNAIAELIKASNDGFGQAQLLLGKIYLSNEDVANARAMYQSYMEDDEQSQAMGYNGLALCDMAEEKYDDALSNIQKGIEVAETNEMQDLLYNEIVAYEKKLDFETAKSKLSSYLELYPQDEEAQKEHEFLLYR